MLAFNSQRRWIKLSQLCPSVMATCYLRPTHLFIRSRRILPEPTRVFAATCWMIIAAQVATAAPTIVPPAIDKKFQSIEWRSNSSPDIHRYRLYVPEKGRVTLPAPLLVWLHGDGERGDDNLNHLRWMNLVFEAENNSPPLFILAVQHPANQRWFTPGSQSDTVSAVSEILEQIQAKYPIDRDRIYLSGVSTGGTACWELACRHPQRFAAMAPMASTGGDVSKASKLAKIPIWAFHSRTDRLKVDRARAMVDAIQSAGGNARLTETDQKTMSSHDCWTPAIQDYHLLDWLLAQRRGHPVSWPKEVEAESKPRSSTTIFSSSGVAWIQDVVLIVVPWLCIGVVIWLVVANNTRKRRAE